MAATTAASHRGISDSEYKRRINAWTMYDWANSAFVTTIMAAVLPIYFSQVAGSTLPSEAIATAYWSLGLSLSLLVVAIISPILGTISDVARGKKNFLAVFAGLGILATAFMVLIDTGDWMLASILAIIGRIGLNGSVVFYDALLPHVARPEDQDRVSARGYAMGYLGGGLLLAINVVMIFVLPDNWGPRLSFLSVAIWWAVFSIPLFRRIPEPPAAGEKLAPGETVIGVSFQRLWQTVKDIRRYRELFKYLIAFLIYNDGIGTIIGVAAIYGAELGFGSIELILALLLVQFVGIPYSLIFGSLPSSSEKRRPQFLAFVIYNLVALPVVGILASQLLPGNITGAQQAPFAESPSALGQGVVSLDDSRLVYTGNWQTETVPGELLNAGGLIGFLNNPFGGETPAAVYYSSSAAGDRLEIPFNGQQLEIVYSSGPEHGLLTAELDGKPYFEPDAAEAFTLDTYSPTVRYGLYQEFDAGEAGEHVLTLINSPATNPAASGQTISITSLSILPPVRQNSLPIILGLVIATEIVGIGFAWLAGKSLFGSLVGFFDTRRSIILSLSIYAVIAVWGFFLNSTVEFWFLAWMVAVVQGGSQALSRSLYAAMSPAAKSGEFFGLFGVMEKFASLIGPLLFAAAGLWFGSSRPAILSLIALFIIGIILLQRVDVDEGRRVAQAEDAALLK